MIELKYFFVLNKYFCYNYYEYNQLVLYFNSISTYTYLTYQLGDIFLNKYFNGTFKTES